MQIVDGPMAEFECDSNAVACPRLYPGRASGRAAGPRCRIVRRQEEGNIQIRRARRLELESTFCRTRVCASKITTRSGARWKVRGSRGREKKIFKFQHEPDMTRAAFVVWTNDLFTVHGMNPWALDVEMIRQTFYITRLFYTRNMII